MPVAGPWLHLPPPTRLPEWVLADGHRTSLLAYDTPARPGEPNLLIRAIAATADRGRVVIADLPVDDGLRRHLTDRTEDARDRLDAERRGLKAFLEFIRRNPDHYRVVEESQFVDVRAYRKYYTDFARAYRGALADAERRGQIRPGNSEVRAWSLMGMAVYLGQRYALMDPKAPLEPIVDAAMDMIAHGLTM